MAVVPAINRVEKRRERCQVHHSAEVAANGNSANRSAAAAVAVAGVLKEAHIACRAIPAMAEELVANREVAEGVRNLGEGVGGGYPRTIGAEGGGICEVGAWVIKAGGGVDLELVFGEVLPSIYAGNSPAGEGANHHPYDVETWRNGWVRRRDVNCAAVDRSMADKLATAGFATSTLSLASASSSPRPAKGSQKGEWVEKGERGGDEQSRQPRRGLMGLRALLGRAFRRGRSATAAVAAAAEEPPMTGAALEASSKYEGERAPWPERVLYEGDISTSSTCSTSSSSSASPSSYSGYRYDMGERPPRRRRGHGLVMAASFVIDGRAGGEGADVAYGGGSSGYLTTGMATGSDMGGGGAIRTVSLTEEVVVGGGGGGGEGQEKAGTKKVLKYIKKRRGTAIPPSVSSSSLTSIGIDGGNQGQGDTWRGGMDDDVGVSGDVHADRLGASLDHLPHHHHHHHPGHGGADDDNGNYVRDNDVYDRFGAKDAGAGYSLQAPRLSSSREPPSPSGSPLSSRISSGNSRHDDDHHHHNHPQLRSMRFGRRLWRTTMSDSSNMEKNGVINMVSFLAKVAMLAMVKRGVYPRLWALFQGACLSNLPFLGWLHRFGPLHRALEPFHMFTRPMLVLSIATMLRNLEEEENAIASEVHSSPHASGAVPQVLPTLPVQPVSGYSDELVELQQKVEDVKGKLQSHQVQLPLRFNDREIARFLVGARGSVENCVSRLKEVAQWHANYCFLSQSDLVAWNSYVSWHGRDMFGRPCLVLRMGHACQMLKHHQRQKFVQALVSQTEYGVTQLLQDYEAEQFTVVMDCDGVGLFTVPLGLIKNAALMLQQNYPTRLAAFYLIKLQMVLRSLVGSVKLVLGERTSRKIKIAGSEPLPLLEECFGGITSVPSDLGGSCECHRCLQVQVEVLASPPLMEEEKSEGSELNCEDDGLESEMEESVEDSDIGETSFNMGKKMFQSLVGCMQRGLSFREREGTASVDEYSSAVRPTHDHERVFSSQGTPSAVAACTRDQNFVDDNGISDGRESVVVFDLATWIQRAPPHLVLRLLVTTLVVLVMLTSLGTGEPWRNLAAETALSYI